MTSPVSTDTVRSSTGGTSRPVARLVALALCLLVGVFSGCATVETPGYGADNPAALRTWQEARAQQPPIRHANLVYAGVSVHDFFAHYKLPAWRNSRQLIDSALANWLDLPPHRRIILESPTAERLGYLFQEQLPDILQPDDTLVFYLGTHQLHDGKILMGNRTDVTAAELGAWMRRIPNRTIFIADTCYAELMESAGQFPDNVVRIYSSRGQQEATEVFFDARVRATHEYFDTTGTIIRHELGGLKNRYSVLGLMAVHALRIQLSDPMVTEVRLDTLYQTLEREQGRYIAYSKMEGAHMPLAVNMQPWPLGVTRAATDQDRRPTQSLRLEPLPLAPQRLAPWMQPEHAGDDDDADTQAKFAALEAMLAGDAAAVDLEAANLLMGQILQPELDVAAIRKRLDTMAAELRERLAGSTRTEDKIAIIRRYLYEDQKITPVQAPYDRDFLLDEVITTGKGRCSALTALYLALGARLNLPLGAVCLPEHIFIRWQPIHGEAVNIETTLGGITLTEEQYVATRPWPDTETARAFYMQPLDRRQIVAAYLSPLSSALRQQGRVDLAIRAGRLGVTHLPHDAEGWNNLGMAYRLAERTEEAKAAYQHALVVNPAFAEVYNNLAATEPKAIDRIPLYKQAVTHKPELGEAWRNLAYAQYEVGRYQFAWLSIRRCKALGYPIPAEFVDAVRHRMNNP